MPVDFTLIDQSGKPWTLSDHLDAAAHVGLPAWRLVTLLQRPAGQLGDATPGVSGSRDQVVRDLDRQPGAKRRLGRETIPPFPLLSDPDRSKAIIPLGVADEKDDRLLSRPALIVVSTGPTLAATPIRSHGRGLPIIAWFPADLAQDERRLEFRPSDVASVVDAPSLPIPESRVQRSDLDVSDRSRLDVDQTVPRPDPPRAEERAEARDDPRSTPFRSGDQGERGCLRLRDRCGLVSKLAS